MIWILDITMLFFLVVCAIAARITTVLFIATLARTEGRSED